MPVLTSTNIVAEITWLGRVSDRDLSLRSHAIDQVLLNYSGIEGEWHSGLTRASCSRVVTQYPRGTEIRNTRQISILSEEELEQTAREMGIPALPPEWLGASIILKGIPDFSNVPPSSRLISENGTGLVVDMENAPCHFPAREVECEHPGKGKLYKPAAKGKRGVVAWVERPGKLSLGDKLTLHVPPENRYHKRIL